ncbi:GDP-L-fucose synthase family protein [Chromobacterium violaceum]|uniref:GDP-L-fucose synthase family protein n=1 Tax=Chromobacterium violaceum TaxID=536 RepID=UPI00143D646B|nr:GDP-L-fucose synthase [Chromobacterium violaceum]QIY79923.1 GDP-L-fucose synthase [Chromobacterium violaceum]
MRILLTGASGMLGRNLLGHPSAEKFHWLTPSHTELDLSDFTATLRYIDKVKPDCIIHAAGKVGGIQANIREPVKFLIDNLDMGRNILQAAYSVGIAKLINIGSSCMYPRGCQTALKESDVLSGELEPTNEGYALAKITVAKLAEYICRENPGFNYKTVIPCNLYGKYDKFDPKWSHLIPAIIHKLHQAKIAGHSEVEIWGSGEARREFLFAEDLASALLKAIDDIEAIPSYMNIGLGHDYSVNEYYQAAAAVIEYHGTFTHDLSKPVGMDRKLTDTSLAKEWGWKPQTSLADGLMKTYQHYLQIQKESH